MTTVAPSVSAVWLHHETAAVARRCLAKAFRDEPAALLEARVYAMTAEELRHTLEQMESEQDLQTTLFLFAATEAWLFRRARYGLGKALARRLRETADARQRMTLELVLDLAKDTLKWEPDRRKALGEFRQLVAYRDWLAHGRRWRRPSALGHLHPSLLRERVEALQRVLESPGPAPPPPT